MKCQILVVEDDLAIQKAIVTFLKKEGYEVTSTSDGEEALKLFHEHSYHLILLDMMLPKKSGEEILQVIRQHSVEQPVMIISALDDEFIQVDAFTKEVEDYVVKPFSMNVLLLKISRILKRIYGSQKNEITVGEIKLLLDQYEVLRNNEPVTVTPKEFEILQVMFMNLGKVYSREELLTIIWGYDFLGDSRTIDVHIKNIRQKLGSEVIKTIKGIGYKVEKR